MIYGIDVSKHNTVTDWNTVKASGKKFVFIRLGWINSDGSITKDEKFEEHYAGARAVGLDVGVFVYSYLNDSKYSRASARNTVNMLEGKMITYPVAFDFEEYKISAKLSKSANTDICYEFLSEVQRLGYFAMMYTYTSFVQSYLNIERLKPFAMWIADYRDPSGTNCPYKGTWGIWQYKGNTGKCNGVSGACDINMSKYDYAATIKAKKLNGLDKVKERIIEYLAVLKLKGDIDYPEFLVILSDMEFDEGSSTSIDYFNAINKNLGTKTKIVWWNLNSRNTTSPEMDESGNIFISGYNPMILKYLEVGFNAKAFLSKLISEYDLAYKRNYEK